MKNLFIMLVFLICVGCANWNYKDITYNRCQYLDKVHVHFYNHQTYEWSCLNMDEGYYEYEDEFRIKYRVNKKGKIIKVKLVK